MAPVCYSLFSGKKKRLRKCVSQIFQTDWSDTFTQFSRTYYFFLIHKIQATLHFHDIFWPRSATFVFRCVTCVSVFQFRNYCLLSTDQIFLKISIEINFSTWLVGSQLKVSRSRNKIVEPQILPKNEQTNLFFYPDK